ncbi:hypothetical protein DLAC_09139 [Tieghemostelium lacteum]|uniref:Uncharacterized protein n=1 Tax=Tieghemostelium lacteum TaxID=361077 RepID=A0A151Z990_TIELA|nr:hypothetical protein DLAC_09139 [Tieghemostelium lacteum]|eukprot:KYQ90512.1 hypothetical protein DLAC_09139 [Tieghemostelium lacteum]
MSTNSVTEDTTMTSSEVAEINDMLDEAIIDSYKRTFQISFPPLFIVFILCLIKSIHVFKLEKSKTVNYLKEIIHFIITFYYFVYTILSLSLYLHYKDEPASEYIKYYNITFFFNCFTNLIFITIFLLLFLFWIGIYSDVFEIKRGNILTGNTRPIFIGVMGSYFLIWLLFIVAPSGCYTLKVRMMIEKVFYWCEIVIFTPIIIALLVYSFIILIHYRFLINRPNQRLRLFLSGIIYCSLCLFFFYSHAPYPTMNAEFANFLYYYNGNEYIFHLIILHILYFVYYDWECYIIRLKNFLTGKSTDGTSSNSQSGRISNTSQNHNTSTTLGGSNEP